MGKIPKYTDSERLMTPKTDYLLADKKVKSLSAWISKVCDPQKTRVLCHLKELTVEEHLSYYFGGDWNF